MTLQCICGYIYRTGATYTCKAAAYDEAVSIGNADIMLVRTPCDRHNLCPRPAKHFASDCGIESCPFIHDRSFNWINLSCMVVINSECLPFHLSPDHDNTSCTAYHDVSVD